MRRLPLGLALCSLALGACGKSEQTGNTSSLDDAVSAEDFETSDVTAIDAATGADANMAKDVDINQYGNDASDDGNNSTARAPSRNRPNARPRTSNSTDEAAPEPTSPSDEPAEANSL